MAEKTERALTPEELEKIRAETRKLNEETEQASVRNQLDFQRMRAEARKVEAEAATAEVKLQEEGRRQKTLLADDIYHHVYRFSDSVSSSSVASCMSRLAYWNRNDPGCPIEIIFSSPGGSVIDGMVLFDYIGTIRRAGHRVTTSTMGWAASMAGILLQAGDLRVMYREAWVLIHEVSFGTSGKIGEIEDCVDPCLPVLMADLTWKQAGQLKVGDPIFGFTEYAPEGAFYRQWRPATVTAAGLGVRDCYKVSLRNGDSLVVSENHPFLSRNSQSVNRWRKAKDLLVGHDYLARVGPYQRPELTWDAGFIAGLLDGDGSVCRIDTKNHTSTWRINFGQNAGPTFDRFVDQLRKDGFKVSVNPSKAEPFMQANVYGLVPTMRLLMYYRPPRLLTKFWKLFCENPPSMVKQLEYEAVTAIEPLGLREVVLLGTSSETFIGQGYGMHNTVNWARRMDERVIDIFAERCRQAGGAGTAKHPLSRAKIKKGWTRKDWWLDSAECLDFGLVDEVR